MGISVQQFVESLSSNSILAQIELTNLREKLGSDQMVADAEQLAKELVRSGKLTRYQAQNIYLGRGKGLVFGDYVVLDKIGAGGMGQVFKAQHRRMKRVVALKVLPPHLTTSKKNVQRFYQEVEMAAKLTHPNIVTAYDAGESHGMHYLVMEFVDGQDLSSIIKQQGPLSVDQTVNVILQAARGLTYAHGQGIIHRDIKPSNLLFDRHGVVKVLDMGLARVENPMAVAGSAQEELTESGQVMGTVDYMAPEQAQDTRAADNRADIYSLGCTLYRVFTGELPYAGDTTVKKILAHRDAPTPSLRAKRPEAPEALDRLLQRMMAKRPEERIHPMAAVVATLEKLAAGSSEEDSSININLGDEIRQHDNELQSFLSSTSATSATNPKGSASRTNLETQRPSDASTLGGTQKEAPSTKRKAKPRPVAAIVAGSVLGGVLTIALAVWLLIGSGSPTDNVAEVASANSSTAASTDLPPTQTTDVSSTAATGKTEPSPTPVPVAAVGDKAAAAMPTPAPPTSKEVVEAAKVFSSSPSLAPVIKPGQPIDLLKLVNLGRDSVEGEWKLANGSLEIPVSPMARFQFPFAPPDEYVLIETVEVLQGAGEVDAVLVIGGRQVLSSVDAWAQTISGLSLVDGKLADANTSGLRGHFLRESGKNVIVYTVKKNSIKVECNGVVVIDWTGDPATLSLHESHQLLAGDCLGLVSFQTSARVSRLELVPLGPGVDAVAVAAAAKATLPPLGESLSGPIDLLKRLDVQKHAVEGVWKIEDGVLVSPDNVVNGRIYLPVTPPEEYDLTVDVASKEGPGGIGFGLLVGERPGHVVVAEGVDNRQFVGIDLVSGHAYENAHGRYLRLFEPGKPATIVCAVRKGRVCVFFDDRPIIDFSGSPREHDVVAFMKVPKTQWLFFNTHGEKTVVRLSRVELGPPKVALPAPARVDLVSLADFQPDKMLSEWRRERQELIATQTVGAYQKLAFPADYPNSYVLSALVERGTGSHALALGLPIGANRISAVIDWPVDGFVSGLHGVGGQASFQNPTRFADGILLPSGRMHLVTAHVAPESIRIEVDGRPTVHWEKKLGVLADGAEWQIGDLSMPYVSTYGTGWRITRLELSAPGAERLPAPPESARDGLIAPFKAQHAAAYAKGSSAEAKNAAGDAMFREAAKYSSSDSGKCYVLLDEALSLAVQAGDLILACRAADQLGRWFDLNPRDVQKRSVDVFKTARPTAAKQQMADDALRMIELAALTEQYDWALDLQAAAVIVAKPNSELQRELKTRATELAFARAEYEASRTAEDAAAGTQNDPAVNLAIGRYLCLVRNDWKRAAPLLERGSDAALKSIAALELAAPKDADKQAALGDRWWEASDKAAIPLKWLYMERAAEWYRRAQAKVTGRAKQTIDQRRTRLAEQRKASNAAFAQRHPVDAVKIGNRWYKFFPEQVSWPMAVEMCIRMGGSLPIIKTADENQAIAQYMLSRSAKQERIATWLGCSDEEKEGDFRWLDGASATKGSFGNWYTGEPDNLGGQEDWGYMEAWVENSQLKSWWRDMPPNTLAGFVCEWDR